MEKKSFREDLYYRLNVVNLKIPALHECAEDIPLLANHLLRHSADRHSLLMRNFSANAMQRLVRTPWPGNVRQLVKVTERCVALSTKHLAGNQRCAGGRKYCAADLR